MVSDQFKCIFVHIPKNAGQSVEHVFLSMHGLTWETRAPLLLRPNADPLQGPPRLAHLLAADYVDYGQVTKEDFASYYKFSFVGNPWERVVSFYKYLGFSKGSKFKDFVATDFQNVVWKHDYWFVRPQVEFVCNKDGKLLVNLVGRFENFREDFHSVCKAIGVDGIDPPHITKSIPSQGLERFK